MLFILVILQTFKCNIAIYIAILHLNEEIIFLEYFVKFILSNNMTKIMNRPTVNNKNIVFNRGNY